MPINAAAYPEITVQYSRFFGSKDTLAIILILIASLVFTLKTGVHRYGDGSNYYLMTASLVGDRDLELDEKDISRWTVNKFEDVPAGTYVLADQNDRLHYGKPVLYPLLAAPFFLLFGSRGFAVLNALFLAGTITFSYLFLRRRLSTSQALSASLLFYLCSFVPAYASWVAPEMMLFFFCALCLWLALGKGRILLAAFLIGVVASVKPSFFCLLLPVVRPLFVPENKSQKAWTPVVISLVGLLAMLLITAGFLNQFNPYLGIRGYLPGFPDYPSVQFIKEHLQFDQWREHATFFRYNSLRLLLLTVAGFFIGRYTGLCWYFFPGIVCTVLYLVFRRRLSEDERLRGNAILAGTALLVLFLVLTRPMTYFGGDFIGNRYFFMAPAFVFLPIAKYFGSFYRIALFLPGFIVTSRFLSLDSGRIERTAHARVFPQSALPLEVSLVEHLIPPAVRFPNGLALYAPLGLERKANGEYFCEEGREIVVTTSADVHSITLEGDTPISLRPFLKLRDSVRNEHRIFFYYKAQKSFVIKGIVAH